MFAIEMLPADNGDCLWVEYGDPQAPRRILIDGGISGTYDDIIARVGDAGGACIFELVVISHVDIDHIDGIVKFLENLPPGVEIKEIWFNGWRHLPAAPPPPPGGPRPAGPSGEKLTAMIEDLNLPWNEQFGGSSQAVVVPDVGALPVLHLADGMTLTLLSPTIERLRKLRPQYAKECAKAGLIPGVIPQALDGLLRDRELRPRRSGAAIDVDALAQRPYKKDERLANGSSIAFLAEFDGKSCLFAADAFPEVIVESITNRLGKSSLRVDAFKLPHHGSRANSSPKLLKLVQAGKCLVSTNGAKHHHPDPESIARLLKHKTEDVELCFNYDQPYSENWGNDKLQRDWGYEARFPESRAGWLRVEL